MVRFWQNTHRRLQPEKNTAPLPRVPEMHGSSPKCGAARATTGASGTLRHRCLADALRHQPGQAGARVKAGNALLGGVDHQADALDG